jgi:hypothetical protein
VSCPVPQTTAPRGTKEEEQEEEDNRFILMRVGALIVVIL